MNSIIDIQTLSKTFPGKKRSPSVVALKDLSLQVNPGRIFGFVGPNGAGKSTTIKILLGFLKASHGKASLCNIPVQTEQCRKHVGYLPENPVFHDFLTAQEVLETTAMLRGMDKHLVAEETTKLLALVELSDSSKRPVRGYSKGMTQRLGIANALVGSPDLLILDEPMSGLDPLGRDLVRELMRNLRQQGKTIFFSSHILHDVETICDEVAILLQGELKFQGPLERISKLQTGYYSIHFTSKKSFTDLAALFKKDQLSLSSLTSEIFELTVPQKDLSHMLTALIDMQCEIVRTQPHHPSLESLFMKLVKETKKNQEILIPPSRPEH